MTRIVSALKARKNLGELLNKAYYNGEETIIEKKGKPFAKITSLETANITGEDLLIKTAGVWRDLDTESIKRQIKKAKSDKSSKKEFLARW